MTPPPVFRESLTHSPDVVVWLRELHGISQRQLAKRLGISSGYCNDIESGRRSAPMSMIIELSKIFSCPVNALLAKRPMTDDETENGGPPWAS